MIDYTIERSEGTLTLIVKSIDSIYDKLPAGDVRFSLPDGLFEIAFHPYGENSFPVLNFGSGEIFVDIKRGFSPVSCTVSGYAEEDLDILENRINEVLSGNPIR